MSLPPLKPFSESYLKLLGTLLGLFYVGFFATFVFFTAVIIGLVLVAALKPALAPGCLIGAGVILIPLALSAWPVIKGFFDRPEDEEYGIKLLPAHFPLVFELTRDIARRVNTQPIDEIILSPEDEVGVCELAGLFDRKGTGKRQLRLGMVALNYLTLDQLKSVLAHEYGHFSNNDTHHSRYIYRLSQAFKELFIKMDAQRIQRLNPFYYILKAYLYVFAWVSARFSRHQEFRADRFAVLAFGQQHYKDALFAATAEGTFFQEVGIPAVIELFFKGYQFKNLYSYVSMTRKRVEVDNPQLARRVAQELVQEKTHWWYSHPALGERVRAQGVSSWLPPAMTSTRVVWDPTSYTDVPEEVRMACDSGPRSAAEALFEDQLLDLQVRLTNILNERYHNALVAWLREVQARGRRY